MVSADHEPEITKRTEEGGVELQQDVVTTEETRNEMTTIKRSITTIRHIKPVKEITMINEVEMESHIREVLIGTEIEEDVTELPIGVHDIDDKNLWVRTAEQQSEELLPDGSWVRRRTKKTVVSLPASPTEDMKQQILTEVEKTDEGFTILEIPSAIDVLKDTTLDNEVIEELLAEAASDITEQVPDISADEKYVPTGATTEMAPDAYDIMVSEPLVLESGAVVMDAQPSTEKFKTVIDDNKVHVPVSSREDEKSLNLASIDDKPEPEDLPRTALSGGADLELSYTIEELSDTTMIAFPEKLSEAEKEYMQIQATPTKDLLEEVILMETSNRDQQNKEI